MDAVSNTGLLAAGCAHVAVDVKIKHANSKRIDRLSVYESDAEVAHPLVALLPLPRVRVCSAPDRLDRTEGVSWTH
jgi:hypothetical protein